MSTITGTGGDDNLSGTGNDDVIYGGAGDDAVDRSGGNDTVYGGSGDDQLEGGNDDDLLFGGDGNDSLHGNNQNDTVYGGDGNDEIAGGNGDDVIYGGAGNDSIAPENDNDTVYGGDGDDDIVLGNGPNLVFGDAGNDSIEGKGGDDTISGGAGDDLIKGGGGNNVFIFGTGDGNDTIQGFAESTDVIEVRFFGVEEFADVTPLMSTVDGSHTQITFEDGSTLLIQGKTPDKFTASNFTFTPDPVCYAPDTLILTDRGPVAVEDLSVGDLLVTADHGRQPILRIAETRHRFPEGPHKHKPIEIKAGSLGGGLPKRKLVVSPQHRMLFSGPVVEEMFGEREVLALAKALVGLDHVRAMNGKREVTYYSLLCDRHEVIMAEGAWSETFHPDANALRMICPSARREVEALFPRLVTDPDSYGPHARRVLTRKETEALVEVLLARGFGREDDEIAKWKREAEYQLWDEDLARERATTARPNLRVVS